MGMFDTVHFNCPHCNSPMREQTKSGPQNLIDFSLNEDLCATSGLMGNIFECKCGGKSQIVKAVFVVEKLLINEPDTEEWG